MNKIIVKGNATIYENNFSFNPLCPVEVVSKPQVCYGQALLNSNGTFEFMRKPRKKHRGILIKKLAHGRLSATKDGAILLTLKVYKDEGIDIADAITMEAISAAKAIV